MKALRWFCASLALIFLCGLVFAGINPALVGHKNLVLVAPSGEKTIIGHVDFARKGDGYVFKTAFDKGAFEPEYMEETYFLCLPHARKEFCHFPYPPGDYAPDDSSGVVTEQDLHALEYSILFFEKRPPPVEVDVNVFNGRYFRLKVVGDHLEGTLYGVDLKLAIVPREGKHSIDYGDLDEMDAADQRFPRLLIE